MGTSELMTFAPTRRSHLTGGDIQGARPTPGNKITTTRSLRYLGTFITDTLDWSLHMKTMANQAKSTIRGVSILGNSVRGLNFLHWRQVYNALIILVLMYGLQIWYTGTRQKGLLNILQVAQNEGIRKLTRVFKTTPIKLLHNLT